MVIRWLRIACPQSMARAPALSWSDGTGGRGMTVAGFTHAQHHAWTTASSKRGGIVADRQYETSWAKLFRCHICMQQAMLITGMAGWRESYFFG